MRERYSYKEIQRFQQFPVVEWVNLSHHAILRKTKEDQSSPLIYYKSIHLQTSTSPHGLTQLTYEWKHPLARLRWGAPLMFQVKGAWERFTAECHAWLVVVHLWIFRTPIGNVSSHNIIISKNGMSNILGVCLYASWRAIFSSGIRVHLTKHSFMYDRGCTYVCVYLQ